MIQDAVFAAIDKYSIESDTDETDAIAALFKIDVDNTKRAINEMGTILHSGAPDYQSTIDEQIEEWFREWLTSWTGYQQDIVDLEKDFQKNLGTGSDSARQQIATWMDGCDPCVMGNPPGDPNDAPESLDIPRRWTEYSRNVELIVDGNDFGTRCNTNVVNAGTQYFGMMKYAASYREFDISDVVVIRSQKSRRMSYCMQQR